MVAWAGVEHYNRGMTQLPPPIDEPLDAWVRIRFAQYYLVCIC